VSKPHQADVDAPFYSVGQCVLKEAGEPCKLDSRITSGVLKKLHLQDNKVAIAGQPYNRSMIVIQAACCLISSKPGVAHSTTLREKLERKIRCAYCDAEYRIEYNPVDRPIESYENLLIVAAQKRVDHDHPPEASFMGHTPILGIDTI
jgi:hypothetical protein